MEDKELYEILHKYAEETRGDKDDDLKKLHEKQRLQEESRTSKTKKKFRPQYIFAVAMCMIVIVLCITLPITLIDKSNVPQQTFCSSEDIAYNIEDSIDVLVNEYHIYAKYPTYNTDEDNISISSISSYSDSNLHGALLSYVVEEDNLLFIDLAIVPKTHIIESYEDYFEFPNNTNWDGKKVVFIKVYNEETEMFDMQIYFADEKYDYFVTVESDGEMNAIDVLNLLYS